MPVKLGSTSKDNSLGLKMVRLSDGSPVKFTRVAEADGKEVPWDQIGKSYTAPDGSLVVLTQKEIKDAYGEKNRIAEVVMATDAANIPPMAAKSSYWAQPDKGGERTYALLAAALQRSGKVLVLRYAMRDRVNVAVLRPHDGYLALESLEWDEDIIRPDFAAPPMTATEAEQELADKLIEQMTGKYDHAAQEDTSTAAVMAVINEKIERGHVITPPAAPNRAVAAADLTAALRAAVDAQKPKAEPAVPAARKPRARKAATAA
jgi:DNA end-binding protein Ku